MKISFAIFTALLLITGLAVYPGAVAEVFSAVLNREGSSHGVFIPFLSAWFVWTRRQALKGLFVQTDFFGLLLVFLGGIPAVVSPGSFRIGFMGFILVAAGFAWLLFGKAYFKILAFPILFLVTMVPLPEDFYRSIAEITRHISTAGSVSILSLLGIPHHRSGWLVELPNTTLEVAMACSGIRYLISYFVFGIAYAYLEKKTLAARAAVVAATIPVSLFAGVMRLTAIFVMTYIFGPKMAEHNPHILISWAVFFSILLLSIFLDQFFSTRFLSHGKTERLESLKVRKLEGWKAGKLESWKAGRRRVPGTLAPRGEGQGEGENDKAGRLEESQEAGKL